MNHSYVLAPKRKTTTNMTEIDNSQRQDITKSLEMIGKFLSLLVTGCFCLSVLYDLGYLSALGLGFSEVPTSLGDHLRSAIIWLPLLLVCILWGSMWLRLFSSLDHSALKRVEDSGKDLAQYLQAKVKTSFRVLFTVGMVLIVAWMVMGDRFQPIGLVGIFAIAVLLIFKATNVSSLSPSRRKEIRLSATASIGLAILVFIFGSLAAGRAVGQSRKINMLTIKTASGNEVIKGVVLRTFERVVIVQNEQREIVLFKADDIQQVNVGQPPLDHGWLCSKFRIGC
jgi:hypothetical protein